MKDYIIAANAHLKAAQDKVWDYPEGSKFKDAGEVITALKNGKTIYEAYMHCMAKYGTITGAVMNSFLGHASKSTDQALRKGMKIIFNKLN